MFARPLVSPVPAPNVMRLLANHPTFLQRFSALAGLFAGESALPLRDREVVILRTAWRAGCEYEFAQHRPRAREAGLSDGELRRLSSETGTWPDHDAALVALVDELQQRGSLTDTTWERLRSAYDDVQLIELLMLPGFYRMLAGLLTTVGVPLDEGLPGWLTPPG